MAIGSGKQGRIMARQHVKAAGLRRLAPFAQRVRSFFFNLAILAVCLGLSVAIAMTGKLFYMFVARSGYFEMARIDTSGISDEVREEIMQVAGLTTASGVNLFQIDADRVRDRILTHPKIRAVSVTKRYPRRLVIVGEERRPFAIVCSGGFYFLDEAATVLGAVDLKTLDRPFPYITGVPAEDIAPGQRLKTSQAYNALDLLLALNAKNRDLFDKVSEMRCDKNEGLTLYLKGGLEVRLGLGPAVDRLPGLEAFLNTRRDALSDQYLDLRFDNQIIYKPREPSNR